MTRWPFRFLQAQPGNKIRSRAGGIHDVIAGQRCAVGQRDAACARARHRCWSRRAPRALGGLQQKARLRRRVDTRRPVPQAARQARAQMRLRFGERRRHPAPRWESPARVQSDVLCVHLRHLLVVGGDPERAALFVLHGGGQFGGELPPKRPRVVGQARIARANRP